MEEIDQAILEGMQGFGKVDIEFEKVTVKNAFLATSYSTDAYIYEKRLSGTITYLDLEPTLIGGGASFVFSLNPEHEDFDCGDTWVHFGLGKYLGIGMNPMTGQVSINVGVALASPISISINLEKIDANDVPLF